MWNDIKKTPIPAGKTVDVWCVHPNIPTHGVRFTDIVMRSDGSGYGFVIHSEEGVRWEYLEREGGVYPKWVITHWMEQPSQPKPDAVDVARSCVLVVEGFDAAVNSSRNAVFQSYPKEVWDAVIARDVAIAFEMKSFLARNYGIEV